MTGLASLTYRDMRRVLLRLGFIEARQKGSHVFYKHADGRRTTVPHHKGRDLAPPLVRKILTDIRITEDELRRIL